MYGDGASCVGDGVGNDSLVGAGVGVAVTFGKKVTKIRISNQHNKQYTNY